MLNHTGWSVGLSSRMFFTLFAPNRSSLPPSRNYAHLFFQFDWKVEGIKCHNSHYTPVIGYNMPHPKIQYDEYDTWDQAVTKHPPHESLEEEQDTASCPACDTQIYIDAVRCPSCGNYLSMEDQEQNRKPKLPLWFGVLMILALASCVAWLFVKT